jgi:molybdate transport system regulatory protein
MAKRGETRPKLRLLMGAAVALGPGKARLLDAIAETGSISAAARRMGMSYRRAWTLVEAMNRDFVRPLVETNAGGAGGGGASVTALGTEALSRYRAMEDKAAAAVEGEIAAFEALLARIPEDGDG